MPYIFRLLGPIAFFVLLIPISFSQAKPDQSTNDQLIVLFHGFGSKATDFNTMQGKLEEALPAVSVIALISVEKMQSLNLSIKEQAEACFKELESKVDHIHNKSIVLIGHSQGGVRAYAFLKRYAHLLKVKGLITLATPWEGVPGARVDIKMLLQHLTDPVLNDLQKLSFSIGYPDNTLAEELMLEVQRNQNICMCPGAKDLIMGSEFLRDIKETLPHEQVPILAIGGGRSDFRLLVPNKKGRHSFKALNRMYTSLVVGSHFNRNHDMKVPLYSQHALNIVPNSKKNFKRIFIKDVFHSAYIWTILAVPPSENILLHPRVLHTVISYVKKFY